MRKARYLRSHNANYYRELAEYEFMTRLCREVRLKVKNIGEVAAHNVRVELVVPTRIGLLPTLEMPKEAEEGRNVGGQNACREPLFTRVFLDFGKLAIRTRPWDRIPHYTATD
jgi:hypothetical protein